MNNETLEKIKVYMNLDYEIVLKKVLPEDGGGYFAYYKDFNGVMGDGESVDDALKDVRSAFERYLEDAIKNGKTISKPSLSEAFFAGYMNSRDKK